MYKRLRTRENRLRNNGETSNDGDASAVIVVVTSQMCCLGFFRSKISVPL